MHFSTAFLAAAFLLSGANALNCTQRLSNGVLSVWKTGINFGTKINLDVDPNTFEVVTTTGGQQSVTLTACDANTIVFPGAGEIVTTKGRLETIGGCLGRNSTTGAVRSTPCSADDQAALDQGQLWQFSLVFHPDGEMTGSDREIVPFKKGTFTHIAAGKLELATTQGPSTFFLTFDFVE
ncbi:hypothetical protein MKEN_01157800 [Mycena kentingensis (nom. inval.)]|nr:hypothetical protein MKEN_01157800 [Mycena kentingensis (nom. inval.)]